MLYFETAEGNKVIPEKEFEKIQEKNLLRIKNKNQVIKDADKLSVYNPNVRFKNVSRTNADGTTDVIISPSVYDEFPTGFLPKRAYQAIRFSKSKKNKLNPLTTSSFSDINTIQVKSSEIIGTFNESLEISEIEELLGEYSKKGGKYYA